MKFRFHLLSIAVVTTCSVIGAADLPHDPIHAPLFPPQLLIQHREQIGLTDKQVDRIHAQLEQAGRQAGHYQKQVAEATRKLAELLSVQGIDEPAAMKQLDELLTAEEGLKRLHLRLMIRIRNELTAQQRQLAANIKRGPQSDGLEQRLRAKMTRIEKEVARRAESGQPSSPAVELMQSFQIQMQAGRPQQAEAALDRVMPILGLDKTEKPTDNEQGKLTEFYEPDQVQVIHLQVRDSDLAKMKSALPQRIYVPATFRWGDQTIENVGVRYKGNSSSSPRQPYKRSFLIKFNEFEKGRTFLGLRRVALDNGVQFGSLFSEQLITGVLKDLGITASRCNFAKLYLNGKYHGVYVNVERIDTVFVKSHFADGGGALCKVDEGGPGANLGPLPQPPGPRRGGRQAFEPKSKSARPDARDVLELISKINETPADEFATVMESTIEMDAFLQTMAVMLFSGAFDQLTGWNPHNYYLYRDPQSNRWHYLPWDLDVGFADNAFRRVPVVSGWNAAWPIPGGPPRPLIERIVDDPGLLERYRSLADGILEKYFHPKILLPKIDALYERIKDDLAGDPFPHRRVTNPEDRDYQSIIASIKDFVQLRYETARAQLDAPGARPKLVRNQPCGQRPQPGKPSADAPSELRVVAQTMSSVTLRWKDNAKDEMASIVQRADREKGQEFRDHIGKPGTDIATASDSSVVAGRTYRYRVYAIRPTPTGPQGTGVSNTITVRVPDE